MPKTSAYATFSADTPLVPHSIERRAPGAKDVAIDILYCGVCHSDIHQSRNEWGHSVFPMVPGHEIVGRVREVGSSVETLEVGDRVGVGNLVDSCRTCEACLGDFEPFCMKGAAFTYNSSEMDRKTPTFGGYSKRIVVPEHFALKLPKELDLPGTAPLLCAGVATYAPLRRYNCTSGSRVAVIGLGGLGHLAVKFAAAMGAEVAVLTSSPSKVESAKALGARRCLPMAGEATFAENLGAFDLILDTVSAPHDYNAYLSLVRPGGTMVVLGVPPEPSPVAAFSLVFGNKQLAGSLVGGLALTREMLHFCARHGIAAEVEVIPIQEINEAYERVLDGQVNYRYVIDMNSLE
ncbi:MAG: NAD(P)-dependent alcohol dehydrogenase [Myxococcales bacterium]|nr:NAD(P)-dependent alcohol dehydrogenase [Myxococcales bacterium]MDD9972054.1 NAD(P)-dependent alcohol dehydrogenase [Myxococcales bacterium]